MMTTHAPHDLAALATAAYGEAGWVVAIAERDARPVASEHADVPLLGELFEPQYATRELFAHGWGVLGDPKPWGDGATRQTGPGPPTSLTWPAVPGPGARPSSSGAGGRTTTRWSSARSTGSRGA